MGLSGISGLGFIQSSIVQVVRVVLTVGTVVAQARVLIMAVIAAIAIMIATTRILLIINRRCRVRSASTTIVVLAILSALRQKTRLSSRSSGIRIFVHTHVSSILFGDTLVPIIE